MKKRLLLGFAAGAAGAVILAVQAYIMKAAKKQEPPFVEMYRSQFPENPPEDHVVATILFIISGGIWGVIYARLVKHSTIPKGMVFGFLPNLWLWVVVNGYLGKPLFNNFTAKGLLMPVVANNIIWGGFLGWVMKKEALSIILPQQKLSV